MATELDPKSDAIHSVGMGSATCLPPMIAESDMKALRASSSRRYRVIVLSVFPFMIVACLVCAVGNFLLSARFAGMAGMTTSEVRSHWFADLSVSEQYSGALLKQKDPQTS